ncbi:MAG: DNA polymerase III subunit delta' [Chloroflexi bacterium RBG_16_57_9]|nr:MAG: DNA polymerase III subunit delta' [Chloroflexi bacterium RBG_16_57_9]
MWPVIGHEHAVMRLRRGIATGHTSHAYLFTGPAQIGKTTLALAFAQALNCTAIPPPEQASLFNLGAQDREPDTPCGTCTACRKISSGVHPDVRVIEPADGTLKIEQIRTLQRELALSPYEGRYRVVILRQMETATAEAANCLLKTLEEPPSRVVLILTAAEPELILPTIVSRCQQVGLRPLSTAEVTQALETKWGVEAGQAGLLARLSGGRPGWAVAAAQDQAVLIRRREQLERLQALTSASRVDRLAQAEQLSRKDHLIQETLHLWLGWWRDVLLLKAGTDRAIINLDQATQLRTAANRYSMGQIVETIQLIRTISERLEQNVNKRLALEVLMLRLPSP